MDSTLPRYRRPLDSHRYIITNQIVLVSMSVTQFRMDTQCICEKVYETMGFRRLERVLILGGIGDASVSAFETPTLCSIDREPRTIPARGRRCHRLPSDFLYSVAAAVPHQPIPRHQLLALRLLRRLQWRRCSHQYHSSSSILLTERSGDCRPR